jgi:hypothetical protein
MSPAMTHPLTFHDFRQSKPNRLSHDHAWTIGANHVVHESIDYVMRNSTPAVSGMPARSSLSTLTRALLEAAGTAGAWVVFQLYDQVHGRLVAHCA